MWGRGSFNVYAKSSVLSTDSGPQAPYRDAGWVPTWNPGRGRLVVLKTFQGYRVESGTKRKMDVSVGAR